MPTPGTAPRCPSWRLVLTMSLGFFALALGTAVHHVSGQGVASYSPLFSLPRLEGDFKVAPIWMGIDHGKNVVPFAGQSWDLKRDFNMISSYWFLDISGRLQTGPLGVRFLNEPRNFVGITASRNPPNKPAEARFEFTGLRVGVDLDLFRRNRLRAGLNVDYYAYFPIFTEAIATLNTAVDRDGKLVGTGKKILGDSPVTIGAHVFYSPMTDFYGWAPVAEVRVSWPWRAFSGTNVWDVELSAGLRTVPTVLGTVALKGGYRYTAVSFNEGQTFNGVSGTTQFDVALSGWFGELAYYY
jgi:hypothetical protein